MTYAGIFEKCKTLKELHLKKNELLEQAESNIAKFEIQNAWNKRRWEIRDSWKEHSFG